MNYLQKNIHQANTAFLTEVPPAGCLVKALNAITMKRLYNGYEIIDIHLFHGKVAKIEEVDDLFNPHAAAVNW